MSTYIKTYIGPTRFHYVRSDETDPGTVYHEIMERVGHLIAVFSVPVAGVACYAVYQIVITNTPIVIKCFLIAYALPFIFAPVYYVPIVYMRPNEGRVKFVQRCTYGSMIFVASVAICGLFHHGRLYWLLACLAISLLMSPGWLWGIFFHRHNEDCVRAWLPAYYLPHAPQGTWDGEIGRNYTAPQFATPYVTMANGKPQGA